MRPLRSILDASFRYVPSVATSVASTWRRAGWRPTTDEERKARRQPAAELVVDCIAAADAPTPPRRISVRVTSPWPEALPAHGFDHAANTQRDVATQKSHLRQEAATGTAGSLRDHASLAMAKQGARTPMWHIEHRQTQSAARNVREAGRIPAYRDAMVSLS
jgi:hypothetical protein